MADGMDSLVDVLGFVVMEWIIKLALNSQDANLRIQRHFSSWLSW